MTIVSRINFVPMIKARTDGLSQYLTACLMHPVITSYYELCNSIQESHNHLGQDENGNALYTDASLQICTDAINNFDYKLIKDHFDNAINLISNGILEEDGNSFSKISPEVYSISRKHPYNQNHVNYIRNQLRSTFSSFYQMLGEMEKAKRYIESKLSQYGDETGNLKKSASAGMLGAVIGSVLLPGIGTAIGAAFGAGMTNNSIDKRKIQETMAHVEEYLCSSEKLYLTMMDSVKVVYLTYSGVMEKAVEQEKKIYKELQKSSLEAENVMNQYYQFEMQELENILANPLDENDVNYTGSSIIEEFTNMVTDYNTNIKQSA